MAQENTETARGKKPSTSSALGRWLWAGLMLIAVSFTALTLVYFTERRTTSPAIPSPLTSLEGSEVDPALSPDGQRVAFSWDGGTGDASQIYVMDIASREPIALTSGLNSATRPAWSPDGRDIVFLRTLEVGDSDVMVVEARGGSERFITRVTDTHFTGVDWSPDGRHLALVDKEKPGAVESIFLFSIEDGSKQKLTTPPTAGSGDRNPTFSNDGRYLAFTRWWEGPRNEIHVWDLEEGRQRLVTTFDGQIRGMDWLPDDSALLFASMWRGSVGLWRVSVRYGEPTRLNFGENALGVTISRDSGRMVFTQLHGDSNIWRVSGPGAHESSSPQRLIASTRQERGPRYSPDGSKIAVTTDRSGELQIWTCYNDGTHCSALTPQGAIAAAPRWSPGGEAIAFTEFSQGNVDVYVLDVNVGIPFRLTRNESGDHTGDWSGDGQWIYINSDRTGRYEIWKVPAAGGDVEQVTFNGGIFPVVSPDDRFVYFMKLTIPRSIWRLSLETHIERLICEADIEVRGFSIWENLVIYILQDDVNGTRIEAFDMETRKTHVVADLGEDTRLGSYGRHSVSPDGQWIIFPREDGSGADLVLVDPFQ